MWYVVDRVGVTFYSMTQIFNIGQELKIIYFSTRSINILSKILLLARVLLF